MGLDITGLGSVFDFGSKVIDKIFPDKNAAAAAKLELFKLQQNGELAQLAADTDLAKGQLAVNQAEAASGSVFVGGWRPFIGWVCGSAFAWNWVGLPVANFGLLVSGKTVVLGAANLSEMMPVLLGMLGLGAMRTYEKKNGVAKA